MSWTGDDGVEDTLPAKKHIFHTGNGLDIHGAGAFHSSQIAGIHNDLLTGLQVVFDNMTVKFQEYHPFSGKALHDKSLTAEESGTEAFLEENRKIYPCFGSQKTGFLYNQFPPGGNLVRKNTSREAGGKSNHAGTALGGVDILKHGFTGKHPSESLSDAAVGRSCHMCMFGDIQLMAPFSVIIFSPPSR
jgi:hypothetical protein